MSKRGCGLERGFGHCEGVLILYGKGGGRRGGAGTVISVIGHVSCFCCFFAERKVEGFVLYGLEGEESVLRG